VKTIIPRGEVKNWPLPVAFAGTPPKTHKLSLVSKTAFPWYLGFGRFGSGFQLEQKIRKSVVGRMTRRVC
jgi:hypothetical protein